MYWYHAHSRLLYQDGVRFVCHGGLGKVIDTSCRGALYIAPTVPGPYNLISGGESDTQLQNVIQAGPKFVQLYDWNHYPTELLIEEWEKT